mmetsp:Transcript_41520/g.63388  ORF Transcript_41520/g.63388 Transcript_41520/m.63388 type:complete len:103 (+) Transcript_41520:56-364(+)
MLSRSASPRLKNRIGEPALKSKSHSPARKEAEWTPQAKKRIVSMREEGSTTSVKEKEVFGEEELEQIKIKEFKVLQAWVVLWIGVCLVFDVITFKEASSMLV